MSARRLDVRRIAPQAIGQHADALLDLRWRDRCRPGDRSPERAPSHSADRTARRAGTGASRSRTARAACGLSSSTTAHGRRVHAGWACSRSWSGRAATSTQASRSTTRLHVIPSRPAALVLEHADPQLVSPVARRHRASARSEINEWSDGGSGDFFVRRRAPTHPARAPAPGGASKRHGKSDGGIVRVRVARWARKIDHHEPEPAGSHQMIGRSPCGKRVGDANDRQRSRSTPPAATSGGKRSCVRT